VSGVPAFNNRSHDFYLSLDICEGLRPKIVENTLPVYARLMKSCWNSDPNKRPTADELFEILSFGIIIIQELLYLIEYMFLVS
jgi:hypothetical protein